MFTYLGMDQQRKFLSEIMAEKGWKESTLSTRMGLNSAYLNQFFKQNKPKSLPERVRDKLGEALDLHPDSFKQGRRIERPKLGPTRLVRNLKPLGRVVWSSATLIDGRTTVLEIQLTGGEPPFLLEVDQDAVSHLRENLDALDDLLRQREQS